MRAGRAVRAKWVVEGRVVVVRARVAAAGRAVAARLNIVDGVLWGVVDLEMCSRWFGLLAMKSRRVERIESEGFVVMSIRS